MGQAIWFNAAFSLVSGGLAIAFQTGLAGRQQDAATALLFALVGAVLFVASIALKRFILP